MLFAAVMSFYACGIVFASKKPALQEISNTRIATVLVKISCDPDILPLTVETIGNLVLSYNVAGKTAHEVLEMSPDDIYDRLSVVPFSEQGKYVQAKGSRGRNRRGLDKDDDEAFDERAMMEMERLRSPKFARKKYTKGIETQPPSNVEQTLLLRLRVDIRETEAKPAAQEFIAVVVQNLRRTLERTYETHELQLREELNHSYQGRGDAERDLHEATGIPSETKADQDTKMQLEQVVEFSDLNPGMGFGDALDMLRNSVTPPLRISVIWNDLVDYDIDQSIAINMDPIPTAAVGTALELLLKSVSAGVAELGYVIKDGIIVISTADHLPAPQQMLLHLEQTNLPREVLLERKKQLIIETQHEELNLASGQARRQALEERIAELHHQMLLKLESDPVTKELENLIKQHEVHLENLKSLQKAGKAGATDLAAVEEKLTHARIELAQRREYVSQQAGAHRIAEYREDLAQSAVNVAVRKAEMEVRQRQLNETENQLKAASAISPKVLRIRRATEALEQAEDRVNELKIRIGSLREPTVIVIGAD
jgi:hypothetical protein